VIHKNGHESRPTVTNVCRDSRLILIANLPLTIDMDFKPVRHNEFYMESIIFLVRICCFAASTTSTHYIGRSSILCSRFHASHSNAVISSPPYSHSQLRKIRSSRVVVMSIHSNWMVSARLISKHSCESSYTHGRFH